MTNITPQIINFYANDYGKLYRSCGNCSSQCKRNVYIEGVEARSGGALAGINANYGDTATIKDACYDTSHPCVMYVSIISSIPKMIADTESER